MPAFLQIVNSGLLDKKFDSNFGGASSSRHDFKRFQSSDYNKYEKDLYIDKALKGR